MTTTGMDGRIVYCQLPRYNYVVSMSWLHIILLSIIAIVLAAILAALFMPFEFAAVLVGFLVFGYVIWRQLRGAYAPLTPHAQVQEKPHTLLLDELMDQTQRTMTPASSPVPWDEIIAQCTAVGHPLPVTFATQSLREELSAFELPAHLMEPEEILPSNPFGTTGSVFIVIVHVLVAALLFTSTQPLWGLLFLAMGAFWLAGIPAIRDRFRVALPQGDLIIAPGAARDQRDHMWTVDDSILLVQEYAGAIKVTLLGGTGKGKPRKVLTFSYVSDPEFIRLWQCWNHPAPRPQLLEQLR